MFVACFLLPKAAQATHQPTSGVLRISVRISRDYVVGHHGRQETELDQLPHKRHSRTISSTPRRGWRRVVRGHLEGDSKAVS